MAAGGDGHEPCVAALINAGAALNEKDEHGGTALIWAACFGHEPCVAALINARAALNEKNAGDHTALILAANAGHEPCVAALINAGAALNEKTANGYTALICAANYGHEPCVAALINVGAALSEKVGGYTALMLAARGGHEPCVATLIEAGAEGAEEIMARRASSARARARWVRAGTLVRRAQPARRVVAAFWDQAHHRLERQEPEIVSAGLRAYTACPDEFKCPITWGLFRDPVVAADGFTYERKAITEWIQVSEITCQVQQLNQRHTHTDYAYCLVAFCTYILTTSTGGWYPRKQTSPSRVLLWFQTQRFFICCGM
jgi:hypothetical protein